MIVNLWLHFFGTFSMHGGEWFYERFFFGGIVYTISLNARSGVSRHADARNYRLRTTFHWSRLSVSRTHWLMGRPLRLITGMSRCATNWNSLTDAGRWLRRQHGVYAGATFYWWCIPWLAMRRVELNWTQGRLNQWAHWARAQGPRIFFLF